jgi:hypothetical protein
MYLPILRYIVEDFYVLEKVSRPRNGLGAP